MGLWGSIRREASQLGNTLQNHANPVNVLRDLHHTRLAEFAKKGVRSFGHDISAEWKGEGMFGGRVLKGFPLGLGSRTGRRNALFLAAIGATAGAAGAAGGGGAGAGAGAGGGAAAGGTMGGPLGALAPVAGGGGGVGFGSLASSGAIGALGAGGAGAAGGAGMGGFLGSFGGQTLMNTGLNLLGGALQNRAQGKADKANRKAIEDRIRQALAALSPEHIMALAQQFLPQMAANMNQSGQTAIQAVREHAARTGQLESPRALSFEAGVRSKQANDVQAAAFEHAFGLAGNQANAISGQPVYQQQPRMGYADAITNSANQAYFARAMSQPQQPTGTPYRYPYQPGVPYYGQL